MYVVVKSMRTKARKRETEGLCCKSLSPYTDWYNIV